MSLRGTGGPLAARHSPVTCCAKETAAVAAYDLRTLGAKAKMEPEARHSAAIPVPFLALRRLPERNTLRLLPGRVPTWGTDLPAV